MKLSSTEQLWKFHLNIQKILENSRYIRQKFLEIYFRQNLRKYTLKNRPYVRNYLKISLNPLKMFKYIPLKWRKIFFCLNKLSYPRVSKVPPKLLASHIIIIVITRFLIDFKIYRLLMRHLIHVARNSMSDQHFIASTILMPYSRFE